MLRFGHAIVSMLMAMVMGEECGACNAMRLDGRNSSNRAWSVRVSLRHAIAKGHDAGYVRRRPAPFHRARSDAICGGCHCSHIRPLCIAAQLTQLVRDLSNTA